MIKFRGLTALILTLFFSSSLFAEYLYKDNVTKNSVFANDINAIGKELYQKTGIKLYLIMERSLGEYKTVVEYEKAIASTAKDPVVLITFVELDQKIDIFARPTTLYNDFHKEQVLSPNISFFSALMSTVLFARSFDDAKEIMTTYGGTIFPLLAQKAKGDDITEKYAAAMFNGYVDVATQIAKSHNIELKETSDYSNQGILDILRLIFYATIAYGIYLYIRRKIAIKRENAKK